jgi:phosphonate degradation associated HDIG domain protein
MSIGAFFILKNGKMELHQAKNTVDEIFDLYEQYGNADYIGEPVSQLEHMSQSAALAMNEGGDEELILAAFFHDIGHLCEFVMPVEKMDGIGIVDHESIGGQFLLQRGFSERIAKLVQSHVTAKRYLTFKHPDYYNKLSPASKETLAHQGGVMSLAEATDFELDPLHTEYIKMRDWDDRAKETQVPVMDLQYLKELAIKHLTQKN